MKSPTTYRSGNTVSELRYFAMPKGSIVQIEIPTRAIESVYIKYMKIDIKISGDEKIKYPLIHAKKCTIMDSKNAAGESPTYT